MGFGRFFLVGAGLWLILPAALFGLYSVDAERGLIWLLLHQLYYAPLGSWISEPFFVPDPEVGFWVQPIGRLLTAALYGAVFVGIRAAVLAIATRRSG
jgi:hypothetical protein